MNRLALLPIATSEDGKLCSDACPALAKTEEGENICGAFGLGLRDEEDENGDDTMVRLRECIEATTQADRLVAVRDAAVKWVRLARFAEREGHAMGPSNRALVAAVEELESTRAETEGR